MGIVAFLWVTSPWWPCTRREAGISIVPEVSPGEEAIGILSFS